jgi:3-hydroxybutyryl-CoA dehydrogenase
MHWRWRSFCYDSGENLINDKKTIAVIGSGTMGNGIAHVAALSGYLVFLVDIKKEFLDKAANTISANLLKQLDKGLISESQKKDALNSINMTTNIADIANADLVIEAVPENVDIKNEIFSNLDDICGSATILASNTSSISIAKLASKTNRPDKVIGMHFMNPVPIMKLVEVVIGPETSSLTKNIIFDIAKQMNKIPIECNDYPGFVSNRILMPMINEGILCLEQGVATKESIDQIMTLGMAHPMGPLRLADLIGLDICLDIMNVLFDGFEDEKYKPSELLENMVKKGNLGRKSGKGFYNY